jgi:hypothetical protein
VRSSLAEHSGGLTVGSLNQSASRGHLEHRHSVDLST